MEVYGSVGCNGCSWRCRYLLLLSKKKFRWRLSVQLKETLIRRVLHKFNRQCRDERDFLFPVFNAMGVSKAAHALCIWCVPKGNKGLEWDRHVLWWDGGVMEGLWVESWRWSIPKSRSGKCPNSPWAEEAREYKPLKKIIVTSSSWAWLNQKKKIGRSCSKKEEQRMKNDLF